MICSVKPGMTVRPKLAPGRQEWMFAQFCTPKNEPVQETEWGIVIERTRDTKLENYFVRLAGRNHHVILNKAEMERVNVQPVPKASG